MSIRFIRLFLAVAICFAISVMVISCDDKKQGEVWAPITTEGGTMQSNGIGTGNQQTTDTSSQLGEVSSETNNTGSTTDSEESNWSQDYK